MLKQIPHENMYLTRSIEYLLLSSTVNVIQVRFWIYNSEPFLSLYLLWVLIDKKCRTQVIDFHGWIRYVPDSSARTKTRNGVIRFRKWHYMNPCMLFSQPPFFCFILFFFLSSVLSVPEKEKNGELNEPWTMTDK